MDYIKKLDEILFSENVVDEFLENYENKDFFNFLNGLVPEINLAYNQKQNTPWHLYNVLLHSLYAIKNLQKDIDTLDYETKRMLLYVMLFHDLGKIEARKDKEYNGKIFDSFKGHNIVSAKIAKEKLEVFGFNQNTVRQMEILILKHDTLNYLSNISKKYIQKEIDELNSFGNGKQLFEYLIMISKADNLAQNLQLSKDTLIKIEQIEKEFNNMFKTNQIEQQKNR